MRLATFRVAGARAAGTRAAGAKDEQGMRTGVVLGDELVDLARAAPELPRDVAGLLAGGDDALAAARVAAERHRERIPLASVRLGPPVRPSKLLAVGLNYADHVAETGQAQPTFPLIFNKQTTAVNGPYDPIWMPRVSSKLDYEGELAFVIGRRCRHVPAARAHEVIGGYLICNDVSVRDWQARAATMTLGKSWDTHAPLGPWVVTPDEIGDPHALELQTHVDGERRQHSNTRHLIFDCYALVETLSTVCTLLPGDVITTGTPSGVGVAMTPRGYLKEGQRVRIEIENVGWIENEVVPEPPDIAWGAG